MVVMPVPMLMFMAVFMLMFMQMCVLCVSVVYTLTDLNNTV